jgi:hypothetical protein
MWNAHKEAILRVRADREEIFSVAGALRERGGIIQREFEKLL